MSFPPGTEMFQFPGFASYTYVFSIRSSCEGVAPFGYSWIKTCSRFPMTFRSVPRPSSPPGAKASTECPSHTQTLSQQNQSSAAIPPCTEVSPSSLNHRSQFHDTDQHSPLNPNLHRLAPPHGRNRSDTTANLTQQAHIPTRSEIHAQRRTKT